LKPDRKVLIIYVASLQGQKPPAETDGSEFLPDIFKKEGGKMNPKLREKIKKEIRRRTFEQSDRLQQERQNLQDVQHTLDALHEVTGLSRPELKTIAKAAMLSFEVHHEKFFSIKNQILIVSTASICAVMLAWPLFMI
jgi:hypothetical protein